MLIMQADSKTDDSDTHDDGGDSDGIGAKRQILVYCSVFYSPFSPRTSCVLCLLLGILQLIL